MLKMFRRSTAERLSFRSRRKEKKTPYYQWSVQEVARWVDEVIPNKNFGSLMHTLGVDGAQLLGVRARGDLSSLGISKTIFQKKIFKSLQKLRSEDKNKNPLSGEISSWSTATVVLWIRSQASRRLRQLSTVFESSSIDGAALMNMSDTDIVQICEETDVQAELVAAIASIRRRRTSDSGKDLLLGALSQNVSESTQVPERKKKGSLRLPAGLMLSASASPDMKKASEKKRRSSRKSSGTLELCNSETKVEVAKRGKRALRKGLSLGVKLDFSALRDEEVEKERKSNNPILRFSETGTFQAADLVITPGGIQSSKRRDKVLADRRSMNATQQQNESGSPLTLTINDSLVPSVSGSPTLKAASPLHRLRRFGSSGSKNLSRDYCLLRELGRGAGATVYKAVHLPTLRVVAIKRVRPNSAEKMRMVMIEANSLMINYAEIDDENYKSPCAYLLAFYGAYTDAETRTVNIILEYMDGGVLQDFVDGGVPCDEVLLAHIAYRMLRGLMYIHNVGRLIHRDIKPHNVLMNRITGELKVSDMGISKELNGGISAAETFTGTIMYMSPERLEGKPYGYDSDIWSLGLTIMTLAQAKMPFDVSGGFWGLASRLREGPMPSLPEDEFSSELRDFIQCCLQADPTKRSGTSELLQHPFLVRYIPKLRKSRNESEEFETNETLDRRKSDDGGFLDFSDDGMDLGSTCIRRRLTEDSIRTNSVGSGKSENIEPPPSLVGEKSLGKTSSNLLLAFRSKADLHAAGGDKDNLQQEQYQLRQKAVHELQDIAAAVKTAWAERGEPMPEYSKKSMINLAVKCGMSQRDAEVEAVELFEEGLGPSPRAPVVIL